MPTVLFVTNPYMEPLLEGVMDVARERRWLLVSGMRRTGRLPRNVKPDGVVGTLSDPRMGAQVRRYGVPVVGLMDGWKGRGDPPWPVVVPDYRACGEAGARHLLELGAPVFAFYRRFDAPESNAVLEGFLQAMQEAGREVRRLDFPLEYPGEPDSHPRIRIEVSAWHQRLTRRLLDLPKPCAVMAEDDRFGIELIQLALDAGLRVPDDVAVLGCDNLMPDLRLAQVPLSSVDPDLPGVGRAGAELLDLLMRGRAAPEPRRPIPPRGVVERASTALYAAQDERVAGVVRAIRRNFRDELTVPGLAREAGLSVRGLQMAFARHVGRTVRDEIIRCRLAQAKRLLEETDLKISSVAAESGFPDARALVRFFRLKEDCSPSSSRERKGGPRD